MGLLGWIKNQFIDVIEWLDSSNNTLVWRFPDQDQEIKNGAKLTVREGQVAIFVNEGQIGDVFPPGLYSLTTQNLPILTSLKSWKYGFNSPFKAEVYFVNTKQYMDLRWGTMNPIMMRDPDFGVVRIRAFGLYAIQVVDARTFFKELVGTDGHVTTNDVDGALKRMLVSAFTTSIASSGVPALDMAGNYEVVGARIQAKMASEFSQYGLSLRKFVIENISLPPEVEKALDTRTSMGVMGEMGRYGGCGASVRRGRVSGARGAGERRLADLSAAQGARRDAQPGEVRGARTELGREQVDRRGGARARAPRGERGLARGRRRVPERRSHAGGRGHRAR